MGKVGLVPCPRTGHSLTYVRQKRALCRILLQLRREPQCPARGPQSHPSDSTPPARTRAPWPKLSTPSLGTQLRAPQRPRPGAAAPRLGPGLPKGVPKGPSQGLICPQRRPLGRPSGSRGSTAPDWGLCVALWRAGGLIGPRKPPAGIHRAAGLVPRTLSQPGREVRSPGQGCVEASCPG